MSHIKLQHNAWFAESVFWWLGREVSWLPLREVVCLSRASSRLWFRLEKMFLFCNIETNTNKTSHILKLISFLPMGLIRSHFQGMKRCCFSAMRLRLLRIIPCKQHSKRPFENIIKKANSNKIKTHFYQRVHSTVIVVLSAVLHDLPQQVGLSAVSSVDSSVETLMPAFKRCAF